jgi:hypothetical protein
MKKRIFKSGDIVKLKDCMYTEWHGFHEYVEVMDTKVSKRIMIGSDNKIWHYDSNSIYKILGGRKDNIIATIVKKEAYDSHLKENLYKCLVSENYFIIRDINMEKI